MHFSAVDSDLFIMLANNFAMPEKICWLFRRCIE
jgi:hypothetical protein